MPLQEVDFVFSRVYPLKGTLASAKELSNCVVNSLTLTWEVKRCSTPKSDSLKSRDFQFGEPSLTAYLVLEKIPYRGILLFLQVATEHVDGIIGRVVVHVNDAVSVSDKMVSKANAIDGNKWNLPTRYKIFDNDRHVKLIIKVEMEVIVIDGNKRQEFAHKELTIGTTKFRAHKFILIARIPVLKAMLSADMLEGTTGIIELKNMSKAAATDFLTFIYTGRIEEEELTETAEELLAAAVMYEMPDLRAYSEYALRDMITVENVGRLLLLASLHDATALKIHILFFIKRNMDKETASEGWKEAVATNPQVICATLMAITL